MAKKMKYEDTFLNITKNGSKFVLKQTGYFRIEKRKIKDKII